MTKSELIAHCDREMRKHPYGRIYEEHCILKRFLVGLPVATRNEFIDGKPEQVFIL